MKPRILIADDEHQVLESMRQALSPWFEVETAQSGTAVMSAFFRGHFDGLVIDHEFKGGVNGLEVVTAIRRRFPNLPVVIISAVDYSPDVRRNAEELNATFLQKPVSVEEVRIGLGGTDAARKQ